MTITSSMYFSDLVLTKALGDRFGKPNLAA